MNKIMMKRKIWVAFSNKFDLLSNLFIKMDFLIELIEFNNQIELKKLAKERYQIDSDDEEDEIKYIRNLRKDLISRYNKINNRQLKLVKAEKVV